MNTRSCPKCKKDHLTDPVLKFIYGRQPFELVDDYANALEEIRFSMCDDIRHDRRGAFLSRLRDQQECYFRALWVGLLATSEEVVHDASGAPPHTMFAKLSHMVSEQILDKENQLSTILVSPQNVRFSAAGLLNTSTHMSALFLAYRRSLPEEAVKEMYAKIDHHVEVEVAGLRYISGMLRAGKPRSVVIQGVRQISTK